MLRQALRGQGRVGGRTEVRDGDVSFDWSGVYAIVEFYGNELQLRASDSGKDYFSVWLDNDAMLGERRGPDAPAGSASGY